MSPKDYRQEMARIEHAEREGDMAPDIAANAERRAVIGLVCHRFGDMEEIRDGLLILRELIAKGDFELAWGAIAAALASAMETCISDAANKRSLEGAEQST